jgi:hypothetical protein
VDIRWLAVLTALHTLPWGLKAQDSVKADTRPTRLFRDDRPLTISLSGDLRQLFKDRDTLTEKRFPATLTWRVEGGDTGTVEIALATRGHSRLLPTVCDVPPLRLYLPEGEARPQFWRGQGSLKLTVTCKRDPEYTQYVLQELLLYRIYELFTPMSFRTRLARTTLVDNARRDTVGVIWSFFTEDADDVARRNGGEIFEQPGIRFGDVDSAAMLRVGVYQYMVANTDWALQLYHNIRILKIPPGIYYPVPYDFDFSGIIKTPYAHPSPKLPIRSVRERLYRGPCPAMDQLAPVFADFNAKKDTVYALHRTLADFDAKRSADALKFLDEFYKTINDPKKAKSEFQWQCQ